MKYTPVALNSDGVEIGRGTSEDSLSLAMLQAERMLQERDLQRKGIDSSYVISSEYVVMWNSPTAAEEEEGNTALPHPVKGVFDLTEELRTLKAQYVWAWDAVVLGATTAERSARYATYEAAVQRFENALEQFKEAL